MDVYIFRSRTWPLYGFTTDETGANLPAEYGLWTPLKAIELGRNGPPRIGVAAEKLEDALNTRGFYLAKSPFKGTQQPQV